MLDHVHLVTKAVPRHPNPATGKTVQKRAGLGAAESFARSFVRSFFFFVLVELNKTNHSREVSGPSASSSSLSSSSSSSSFSSPSPDLFFQHLVLGFLGEFAGTAAFWHKILKGIPGRSNVLSAMHTCFGVPGAKGFEDLALVHDATNSLSNPSVVMVALALASL